MEKKATSLLTQKKKKTKDLFPVCDENLFFDNYTTQRVGLLSEDEYTVEGWMCPHCSARFDLDNNLVQIDPRNIEVGRA
jgi:hypothetical protein